MRPGLCCICLALEDRDPPLSFQRMTYKSFSSMDRDKALGILGGRILNNMRVTLAAIAYCGERGLCYRLSSDLFPLITYEKAGVSVGDLPQQDMIRESIRAIASHISNHKVRVSTHPSEFNVLATENEDALARTVRELNFYSWFMDQIGCPADYESPINLHINNNQGSPKDVVTRFGRGLGLLDPNCRSRLVVENDDKPACWSVRKLVRHMHEELGCPVTFDYLHHKCHPDGLAEEQAILLSYETWGGRTPLFHYSESRDEANPRAHADYPSKKPECYGLDFDLDFEFKMKDRAIALYESNIARKVGAA